MPNCGPRLPPPTNKFRENDTCTGAVNLTSCKILQNPVVVVVRINKSVVTGQAPVTLEWTNPFFLLSFFSHTSTFRLLDKPVVTRVVPSPPPILAFNFHRA